MDIKVDLIKYKNLDGTLRPNIYWCIKGCDGLIVSVKYNRYKNITKNMILNDIKYSNYNYTCYAKLDINQIIKSFYIPRRDLIDIDARFLFL